VDRRARGAAAGRRSAGAATLRVRCWGLPAAGKPQRVEIRVGDRAVGEAVLDGQPRVYTWSVAAGELDGGSTTVTLRAGHLSVPARLEAGSSDARTLGIAIDWIAIDPETPTTALVE